jgi:glycosidase
MRLSIGNAWEYDSASDEYYLHLFAKEQPDLNWEHTPVRDAVHDIIRFWLDKGVDGFRYVARVQYFEPHD